MALKDQIRRRSNQGETPEPAKPIESQESWFVLLAGIVLTVAVLYDVFWRESR